MEIHVNRERDQTKMAVWSSSCKIKLYSVRQRSGASYLNSGEWGPELFIAREVKTKGVSSIERTENTKSSY